MNEENFGESSHQSDDSERPLKKARYVWQVKGKYHLKSKQDKEENKGKRSCNCNEQNVVEDRKCLDKFLAKTESILDSDDDEPVPKNIDKSISNEIPITLVSPNPKNEDYYLRKWQVRQIARGYIDNTINRVLESWCTTPLDVEDFVENCDHDGRIENQGILMAIEAHGLQSAKTKKEPPIPISIPDNLADSTLNDKDIARSQVFKGDLSSNPPSRTDLEDKLELDLEYPVSVLNAAILMAIERKGLSSNK